MILVNSDGLTSCQQTCLFQAYTYYFILTESLLAWFVGKSQQTTGSQKMDCRRQIDNSEKCPITNKVPKVMLLCFV